MRKLALAGAWLIVSLLLALAASRPPEPKGEGAAPTEFSAARAMADVREIARAPHPAGSAENARVRAYLLGRLRELGLAVGTQAGPLSERGNERLSKWAGRPVSVEAVNVIGLLAGRDRAQPALLLMAHYDSVWASPGAADDAAGIAAILEMLRAIRSGGTPARDVIVLFTDAEELGVNGARQFFERHPLAARVGAVINLEARGSGGRTGMFETGRGNGAMMSAFRDVERPSANSLAVLIYKAMPNNTDFTIPREKGIAGFNFAFIGKSGLYHSPASTPDALEVGSVQDIGDQALEVSRALAYAPVLPPRAEDATFGDVFGHVLIVYPPAVGWALLAVAALLLGIAWMRVRKAGLVSMTEAAGGAAVAAAFLIHLGLLLKVLNHLSGSGKGSNYYDRLAAIPRLELQALLLCLAALLLACLARRPEKRILALAPALLLFLIGLVIGGFSLVLAGMAGAAVISALLIPLRRPGVWAGWFGFSALVLLLAAIVQALAPTATPVLIWPILVVGLAATAGALIDPSLRRLSALFPVAILAMLGAGHLLYLAHFTFLGVGAPIAEVMALYALLVGLLGWPLLRAAARRSWYAYGAVALVVAATALALSVRLDPMAPTTAPYSIKD